MITADQLVLHFVGDYLIQSDWMAANKTKRLYVALVHAALYALPFLLLGPSVTALAAIVVSHALMDRWRLARYVVWLKNCLGPNGRWSDCSETGFSHHHPQWMSVWLLVIVDNTIHVIINGAALAYL